MNSADIVEFLQNQVALFRGFPEDRLKELEEGSRVLTFEPNEAIIEFGDEGRFLGVLLDGEAQAAVTDDSGVRPTIGELRSGDIFGEM